MNGSEIVWLLVMFDLPTVTDAERKAHTKFRNYLLRLGLTRLQWSVYARAYPRDRAAESDRNAVIQAVPLGGRVRCLAVTDLQFEHMICVDGARRCTPENRLEQIVLLE